MIREQILKLVLKVKKDKSWEYYRTLKKFQNQDLKRIQERQLVKIKKIVEKAWEFEVYKKLWRFQPNILKIEDLKKLPTISKKDFKGYKFKGIKNFTSGSTGEPFEFYTDKESVEKKRARGFLSYEMAGMKIDDKFCILWGLNHMEGIKGKIYRRLVHRTLELSAFDMNENKLKEYILELNRFKPKFIQAYTSAIFALAKFMNLKKIKLSTQIKAIITSGETLTIAQRNEIEQAFNCKVINRYGSREFGCIAQECEFKKMHIMEDLFVESQEGEILITDLTNFAMPFVRYKIGDEGEIFTKECLCKRGLPIIKEIKGRVSEYITSPSGKIISLHFLTLFFQDYASVKQFQVVQKKADLLEVFLVMDKEDNRVQERIKREFEREFMMKVEIKRAESIELTKEGKRKLIIKEKNLI